MSYFNLSGDVGLWIISNGAYAQLVHGLVQSVQLGLQAIEELHMHQHVWLVLGVGVAAPVLIIPTGTSTLSHEAIK